ncbi:MAG TPA: Hsp20/alpha crystallin family protein [Dehalococcoidia bacterium]|nr:Hsp20/alpha crystallin family protein [Dehalococcoidia bacterium]
MTSLVPYRSPLAVDRLVEDLFSFPWSLPRPAGFPVDAWVEDGVFVVQAAAPGIDPDEFKVAVKEGVLEIRAERKRDQEYTRGRSHIREIGYGLLASTLRLPFAVDAGKANAEYKDGLLTVRLPMAEAMKPKTIKVRDHKGLPLVGKLLGR